MISTSWFFFLIFLVPLAFFLLYIMKQDKRKGWLGVAIIVLIVAVGLIVALRASRNAANNFEQRKADSEQLETSDMR